MYTTTHHPERNNTCRPQSLHRGIYPRRSSGHDTSASGQQDPQREIRARESKAFGRSRCTCEDDVYRHIIA